jgi:hypothetical protein
MEGSLVAYKVFTNGSTLNASEINDNLMNQSVMVFSNATARSAALTAPVEGMLTWLQDTNKYENYNGSAWVGLGSGILQIVSVTKSDTFSTTSLSLVDITGFSASITPSSASSKVLILASLNIGSTGGGPITGVTLLRGSTSIGQGDAAGSRTRGVIAPRVDNDFNILSNHVNFLDSPATTSSTTYKFQMQTSSGTSYLNRTSNDADASYSLRTASTITLMEVAG